MNPVLGWTLAVLAVAAGYVGWGWRGVALAVSVVVFWLLLQFSRAMRVLRSAGSRPVGSVGSAVMLNSRLSRGLPMMQVVQLTQSLGEKVGAANDQEEAWRWTDGGGDAVLVRFGDGRVRSWELQRAAAGPPAAAGAPPPAAS